MTSAITLRSVVLATALVVLGLPLLYLTVLLVGAATGLIEFTC